MSWVNTVPSLMLPPVDTTGRGRPCPSQARWIFVLGPPAGTAADLIVWHCARRTDPPSPVGDTEVRRAPAACWWARTALKPTGTSRSRSLITAASTRARVTTLARVPMRDHRQNRLSKPLPLPLPPLPFRQVTPHHTGLRLEQQPVDHAARLIHPWVSLRAGGGQQRLGWLPLLVGQRARGTRPGIKQINYTQCEDRAWWPRGWAGSDGAGGRRRSPPTTAGLGRAPASGPAVPGGATVARRSCPGGRRRRGTSRPPRPRGRPATPPVRGPRPGRRRRARSASTRVRPIRGPPR
ncbi:hypothetical protein LX15_005363 [Streptoalloteichus tenebrarius]|uniref:Uncharacterized protein n=1 Tax=Streptoalloteichus tenebrarius (strain ATCC 17920 / DSM 40477 / JCM 4838 / CBS 697.72 / NBRC 16177 / NCIMB 11028 / NRRL B-12390 / A12253. 1 / ISP 5477) TaxID=1933 RepID=A0ABT1I1H2_STRSD|nr:hypothetical protein [Streptoalloteichus tenebrarius]